MATGQARIDTAALTRAIDAESRAAFSDILFDTGKVKLVQASTAALVEDSRMMAPRSGLKLLVVRHSDAVGSADGNRQLSERYAQAVVDALAVRCGIAPPRS